MMVRRGELLIVQRLAIPFTAIPERVAASRGAKIIFDFDDAIFLGAAGALRRTAFRQITGQSTLVVAGNSWLAAQVPPGPPVAVLPTCIDTDRYRPSSKGPGPIPVIGWMGTRGNLPYLQPLIAEVAKLREEGLSFGVRLCSDLRDDILVRALDAEFLKWTPEDEIDILNSFDIGLMPLPDDDWSKGKCSFKIIQYMAVAVPAVASAVGFNHDAIEDGETGNLVKEGGSWADPLRTLLKNPELRRSMGDAARRRAVAKFDIEIARDAYRGFVTRPPVHSQLSSAQG
jgi:glycosyltransferase involved in cell wall biosynthesis